MRNWTVEEIMGYRSPGLVGARIVSDCDIVCDISGAVVCGDWGRHELHTARARLIAAAPDLLEALRNAVYALESAREVIAATTGAQNRNRNAAIAQGEAAIAKATATYSVGTEAQPE